MAKVNVKLESHLPRIAARAVEKAEALVAKTALDIETAAKARSRVDTGRMRAGWETVPTGQAAAEVRNGVEYVIYNEQGTRHMAPQPMLAPSVEDARPGFERAAHQLYDD